MPLYRVEVKTFISVLVDAEDPKLAQSRAERFVEWLSPTVEQIEDYSTDHPPIHLDSGPFDIDGVSGIEEAEAD